ncbi:MAG: glutamine-hydrolyzing GMP synthase [Candidatus Asgardarchaeia archaeon]
MIAIFDFGGQYVYNIQSRLNEIGVKSKIVKTISEIKQIDNLKGIILSGGPESVQEKTPYEINSKIFEFDVPILGICFGHQLLAKLLGGDVLKGQPEFGFSLFFPRKDRLFRGLHSEEVVWMSHYDEVSSIPNGVILGSTEKCKIAAFKVEPNIYGVQFHPEVSHTINGETILRNFAFDICKEEKVKWSVDDFITNAVDTLRTTVSDNVAILGFSGGIDSATCAMLSKLAEINVHIVYIDHGFMRHEDEWVKKNKLFDVHYIDAKDVFFDAVKDITNPDERRRVIGDLFVEFFQKEARRVNAKFLIQGTIAPDVIESTRGKSYKGDGFIKLHHNVGGLSKRLKLIVVEPIRSLFKYQVRLLATKLGLPEFIVTRQPFPGPGLAVRIVGKITRDRLYILKEITEYVSRKLKKYSFSQYFAALVENKGKFHPEGFLVDANTIGVKGDKRVNGKILFIEHDPSVSFFELLKLQNDLTSKYDEIVRVVIRVAGNYGIGDAVIIRAVNTKDFMTAIPGEIRYDDLRKITNYALKFKGVKLVGYEITTKPSSTIEII